jgi:hypothetical protein
MSIGTTPNSNHSSREGFPNFGTSSRSIAFNHINPITGGMNNTIPLFPNLACTPVEPYEKDWFNAMADRLKINNQIKGNEDNHAGPDACVPLRSQRNPLDRRYVDITAMIRSLQRTEGLADCFRSGLGDCEQLECAWRQYCLSDGKRAWTDSSDEC